MHTSGSLLCPLTLLCISSCPPHRLQFNPKAFGCFEFFQQRLCETTSDLSKVCRDLVMIHVRCVQREAGVVSSACSFLSLHEFQSLIFDDAIRRISQWPFACCSILITVPSKGETSRKTIRYVPEVKEGKSFLQQLKGRCAFAQTSNSTFTHPRINSRHNCLRALAHKTWLTRDDLRHEEHCEWRFLRARRPRHKWIWRGLLRQWSSRGRLRTVDGETTHWGWEAQVYPERHRPSEITRINYSASPQAMCCARGTTGKGKRARVRRRLFTAGTTWFIHACVGIYDKMYCIYIKLFLSNH